MRHTRLPLLAAAVLALTIGCQNPFDPKADVHLLSISGNAGFVHQIVQANALTV